MKIVSICFILLPAFIVVTRGSAQPTPITVWPYSYDWTGASDFAVSGDGRTYVGGDGQWGTYTWESYGSTYRQFTAWSGRAYSGGHGSTNGNDTLFAIVDARSRSFTGSEVFYCSAGRESQSVSAYGENDNVRVYVNNTLLKSVLIRSLSYIGDSLSGVTAPLPVSVQRSIFTVRVVIEDNSSWSTARTVIDNISFPGGPLPITLASFNGSYNSATNRTTLFWSTLSEIANFGFEIHRKFSGGEYDSIGFVPGHGTTSEPQTYTFVDTSFTASGMFTYRLVQLDLDGTRHVYDAYAIAVNVTGVTGANADGVSLEFSLAQNFPNPWNPSTTIRYALPHSSFVTLTVCNILGQQVSQLVNEQQQAGHHDVVFNGNGLASGAYYYRLRAGDYTATRKLLLLR